MKPCPFFLIKFFTMKINTIRYVFENKKPELRRIVVKYGLPPAKNDADLWKKTNYLVAKFQEEAMKDIALIHPDRELIIWSSESKSKPSINTDLVPALEPVPITVVATSSNINANGEDNYSNACGCSGANGETEYSNCNGNKKCNCGCDSNRNYSNVEGNDKKSFSDILKENLPTVVVGGLLLVGVALLLKTPKAVI